MRIRPFLPFLSAATAALLACGRDSGGAARGAAGDVGGTLVVTTPADADFLLPPLVATIQGNEVVDIVYERLAEPGGERVTAVGDQGWSGELADRWTWAKDSMSIAFHLNPKSRWHDGRPVTSRDVRFTFQVYKDTVVGAQEIPLIAAIDSVTTPDSLTAVYWFARHYPEQFFDAAYHMRIMPEHVLGGIKHADLRTSEVARHPIGSGRFRFVRWEPGSVIEIVADTTHWRGRAKLDRIMWSIAPDYDAAMLRLFAGDADFVETVRPDKLTEMGKHKELATATYPAIVEGFMRFNLRDPNDPSKPHPIFGDPGVRRALAMAVDRERLVRTVLDTLGRVAMGPVTRAQTAFDPGIKQIPFDVAAAKRALDSLGWRDANGDGVREKNGRPLRFTILAPGSSVTRQRMAEVLQAMFKDVGAQAEVQKAEMNQFVQQLSRRRFDADMDAMQHDPSPSTIRQSWGPGALGNYGSYSNPTFIVLLDSASRSFDQSKANALYKRAFETIVADAPAIWLYEPTNVVGYNRRIRITGMRADAWWANIADWWIPAGERIPRDNVGLRPVAAR